MNRRRMRFERSVYESANRGLRLITTAGPDTETGNRVGIHWERSSHHSPQAAQGPVGLTNEARNAIVRYGAFSGQN